MYQLPRTFSGALNKNQCLTQLLNRDFEKAFVLGVAGRQMKQ
jgi:hypothetical protein